MCTEFGFSTHQKELQNLIPNIQFFRVQVISIKGCDSFGPEPIWSPDFWPPTSCPHGQVVPKNSVPMDKWSPTNLVPLDKWSLEYSVCTGGQAVGIQKYGDRIGWGPFVQGDRICWGPFVQGDRKTGTGSLGIKIQMGSGPNASQLKFDTSKSMTFPGHRYSTYFFLSKDDLYRLFWMRVTHKPTSKRWT